MSVQKLDVEVPITMNDLFGMSSVVYMTPSNYDACCGFTTLPAAAEDVAALIITPGPVDEIPAIATVSRPRGLLPQLAGDMLNPPMIMAVVNTMFNQAPMPPAEALAANMTTYRSYQDAALAIIGSFLKQAVRVTFTPSQWGGGNVIGGWFNVGVVTEALTIGTGVAVTSDPASGVRATWVPSIRDALISTRNQIANDILGEQKYPNYAHDYQPTGTLLAVKYDASLGTYTPDGVVGSAARSSTAISPVVNAPAGDRAKSAPTASAGKPVNKRTLRKVTVTRHRD